MFGKLCILLLVGAAILLVGATTIFGLFKFLFLVVFGVIKLVLGIGLAILAFLFKAGLIVGLIAAAVLGWLGWLALRKRRASKLGGRRQWTGRRRDSRCGDLAAWQREYSRRVHRKIANLELTLENRLRETDCGRNY